MNIVYVNYKQYENNYNTFRFTKCGQICEYIYALAKSKASRGKLNYLHQANDSTPRTVLFLFVTFAHQKNMRILFYI